MREGFHKLKENLKKAVKTWLYNKICNDVFKEIEFHDNICNSDMESTVRTATRLRAKSPKKRASNLGPRVNLLFLKILEGLNLKIKIH
jgi:hypothetical protein